MNSIPIEIVMYVSGLAEEQLRLLHELSTDTMRSLMENPQAELIYRIDRRSGMPAATPAFTSTNTTATIPSRRAA